MNSSTEADSNGLLHNFRLNLTHITVASVELVCITNMFIEVCVCFFSPWLKEMLY